MQRPAPRPTFLLGAVASATCLLGATLLLGGTASAGAEALDVKVRTDLVEKARKYFDPAQYEWKARKAFHGSLDAFAGSSNDLLKDTDSLQKILYDGRSFEREFGDKAWQKENGIKRYDQSAPYASISSDTLRFTWAMPPSYPTSSQLKRVPRPAPLPLLFVLHEAMDYKGDDKQHPGADVLRRRWPKSEFGGIYDSWLFLAPVAVRAKFLEDDGTIRREFTTEVFADFWKRYHVDFDRVVLDGAEHAIAIAASQAVFYAGLVLRGGKIDPDLVKNYAAVPVFVQDEAMEKALKEAGHPDVTRGDNAALTEWLKSDKVRRRIPTKFSFTSKNSDHMLAQWVNLDQPDMSLPQRNVAVSVDREKNAIELAVEGVETVSLFLNDKIVDLDKEVTVSVNGEAPKKFKVARHVEGLLDSDPISLRKSMYLGWLFPGKITGLKVPAKKAAAPAGTAPPTTAPAGSEAPKPATSDPLAEAKARNYFEKGQAAEAEGDVAKAKAEYKKVCEQGDTPYRIPAEKRIKELEAAGASEATGVRK
jgi:hypothetical protein